MGNPAFLVALLLTRTALASPGATPVTPHSSPEGQGLMAFFGDIYGKKVLEGPLRPAAGLARHKRIGV